MGSFWASRNTEDHGEHAGFLAHAVTSLALPATIPKIGLGLMMATDPRNRSPRSRLLRQYLRPGRDFSIGSPRTASDSNLSRSSRRQALVNPVEMAPNAAQGRDRLKRAWRSLDRSLRAGGRPSLQSFKSRYPLHPRNAQGQRPRTRMDQPPKKKSATHKAGGRQSAMSQQRDEEDDAEAKVKKWPTGWIFRPS
ncbi:hypothetical protein BJ322DRAFT_406351 [Thelephora terrestris]|uniref:Uncharacterized protein n=1 Tax=Thelephora terrestris TaxID=56493 RepID=A0A9P6HMQ6_9AGAM|nr:hypothetical protein BJ322DRAFT_406351 [Thelephora terrestris]